MHGEGGSGGALGLAVGDRILMHEFAIYSVIPPEGCAAILWRDSGRKVEAAEALKLTAPDLLRLGLIDEIVSEPAGGSHTNHDLAATLLDTALGPRTVGGVGAGVLGAPRSALPEVAKDGQRGDRGVIQRLWQPLQCDDAKAEALVHELGIAPVTARLLCIRGISDLDQARRFLSPSLDDLLDPFALTDMPVAVDRILAAIARSERIAVHGDYDVDGVTSTVILRRALELLGADVIHFIPERLRDGYGLQPASLDRLAAENVRLVISVDCGIRGMEAATHARALGLDLIITDHHEPDTELPNALAVINPKRHDCAYPRQESCGCRCRAQARAGAVRAIRA